MAFISPEIDPTLVRRFSLFSRAAGLIVASIGLAALAGHLLNKPSLRGPAIQDIMIMPNAGLGLACAGAALYLLAPQASGRPRRWAGRAVAVACLLLGSVTLSEHLFSYNAGIDELLMPAPLNAKAVLSPGRMGPPASLCLSLAGISLLVMSRRPFSATISQGCALLILLVAMLPSIGYLLGTEELYGLARYTAIALHTSVTLLALGAGLLFARPAHGMTSPFVSPRPGGLVARRLMIPVVLLPLVLARLELAAHEAGWFNERFGDSLLALAFIAAFTGLTWWSAAAANRLAAGRAAAERARREMSDRLTSILETTAQGLLEVDSQWRCTYLNRAGETLLGVRRENLIGRDIGATLPDLLRTDFRAALAHAMERTAEVELNVHYPPLQRWYNMFLKSSEQGVAVFMLDATERKRKEDERRLLLESERAARADAEQANHLKDEFLAVVSHELRNPLNAILGWAQIIRRRCDHRSAQQGAEIIERNARVQTQLVEDLLDMSRITSGKLRLQIEPVELQSVVQAAVDAIEPMAQERRISLSAAMDEPVGRVAGDPDRLHQIIWNLLTNAIKFTPPGGRVQVMLHNSGGQAEIQVSDNGQGIAADFLPHLFSRFRQADSSTTRKLGGLGLGLSIVRQLTELHGGNVQAESPGPGLGATFIVTLPLLAGFNGNAPALLGRDALFDPSALRFDGLTVLVVDDDPDSREYIREALESRGCRVLTAGSTAEALGQLEHKPDLLLSDLGMPERDGYDLIRQIRAREAGSGEALPAAALTAFARPEDRRLALQAGYQLHVPKPLEEGKLLEVVARLTRGTAKPS